MRRLVIKEKDGLGLLSPEPIRQKEIIYWSIYIILILNLFIEENDRKANIFKYLDI